MNFHAADIIHQPYFFVNAQIFFFNINGHKLPTNFHKYLFTDIYGSFTTINVQKQNGEIAWNRVDDMTAELYENENVDVDCLRMALYTLNTTR